jgi:hypothetical protein
MGDTSTKTDERAEKLLPGQHKDILSAHRISKVEMEADYGLLLSEVLLLRQCERQLQGQLSFIREQEKAPQQRAEQLIKANNILRQSIDILETDIDFNRFVGHVLAQEAITNVCKHARASQYIVLVNSMSWRVRLLVQDNGSGFLLSESTPTKGFGLVSMQERTQKIGAKFSISSHPGQRTQVIIEVESSK